MKRHNIPSSAAVRRLIMALSFGLLVATGAVQAYENPVDSITNTQALGFPDVDMEVEDYDAPFQRTGPLVTDTRLFEKIVPGLPASEVKSLFGEPLAKTDGTAGKAWDYNFTLALPVSNNRIVCQYKVVFDDSQQVEEAVWRRRQCARLITEASAAASAGSVQ